MLNYKIILTNNSNTFEELEEINKCLRGQVFGKLLKKNNSLVASTTIWFNNLPYNYSNENLSIKISFLDDNMQIFYMVYDYIKILERNENNILKRKRVSDKNIVEKPEKKFSNFIQKYDELIEIIKKLDEFEKKDAIQLLIQNLKLEPSQTLVNFDHFDELSFNNLFINFEELDNIPSVQCL